MKDEWVFYLLPLTFCLWSGLAQDCRSVCAEAVALGFPEFESIHLADFSTKAQFSKSAASTIPPRPQVARHLCRTDWVIIAASNGAMMQLIESICDTFADVFWGNA